MDFAGFFRRGRLDLPQRENRYGFVEAPNLDEFLFLPVSAGYWKQHELWDGTYNLDDLLDVVEMIRVKRENEWRAKEVNLYR